MSYSCKYFYFHGSWVMWFDRNFIAGTDCWFGR